MLKYLIIGYGNTLRSDDGVGVRVAQTIAQQQWQEVRSLWVHQLTPELAEDIASAKAVIFVDAVNSNKLKVEIQLLQPVNLGGYLGHTGDPRSLLFFAQALYGSCPPAWWVLIPGSNFEFGEQLSPMTELFFQQAISLIKKLIISSY